MSYSSNPLLPKARAAAVRLVVEDNLPIAIAARKSGIHRVTLWRWYNQWLELNHNVEFINYYRPNRSSASNTRFSKFKLTACKWSLPTRSSRPHSCKHAVSQSIIERITHYRRRYGRCAVIVHAYCVREGTIVSLSTVRRVLHRLGLTSKRKWKQYRPPMPRPNVTKPGDLVQTDTVHLYDHATKQRTYLYTLVDLYSRWAYVEHHSYISQQLAAAVIKRGEDYSGFHFNTVQADNGPEFGRWFEDTLKEHGTTVRHSRVRRPNDNAYVERFNRTIQEECTGSSSSITQELNSKVLSYLAYYNDERLHLGLQCRTPLEMLQRS
jgi:putative transposase